MLCGEGRVRKPNLSEWADVAQVVSAIAVVISLLYVGYQIRANTSQVRAANRQELVNRSHSASLSFAENPELSAVLTKVAAGESISSTEQRQFSYVVRAVLYDAQEAFLLNREGGLDAGYWATRSALISVYLAEPPAREAYEVMKSRGLLDRDFVLWVDHVIGPDKP